MARSSSPLRWSPLSLMLAAVVATPPGAAQQKDPPAPPPVAAPAPAEEVVVAVRASEPMSLDGLLDEPVWRLAAPATAFRQVEPDEGQAV